MKTTRTILDEIMVDVRREVADTRARRPLAELTRRLADAPPARSLAAAVRRGFGLIAEIKERSPSQGPMRPVNVSGAPAAYESSPLVRGISVLTNHSHFGMCIERLQAVRESTTKPVLRKDFIFDEYQLHEARAFGADAVLLMANLLTREELARLNDCATGLGLEVLFECHDEEQIRALPSGAVLCGVNSRSFAVRGDDYATARAGRASGSERDLTTDLTRFDDLAQHLPPGALKVAESGVGFTNAARLRDVLGYQAILVGTSLLMAPDGVEAELARFDRALDGNGGSHA